MKFKAFFGISVLSGFLFTGISCKHELPVTPAPTSTSDDSNGSTNSGNGNNGNGNNGSGNGVTCNPDTVYFQNDILPLFVSNCAMSSCHDAQSHQEGIILNSYSNIINTGNVRAFDPNHGKVYRTITTSDQGDRMPPSPRPSLTSAQANMIATWINQGALNNVCNATGNGCDTTNVTYSGTIVPILQSSCIGCHTGSAPGGNVTLSSYAGVRAVALNGHLFGSVNHSSGYFAMPKNLPKIPDCQIAQIRIWIQNGSLNN